MKPIPFNMKGTEYALTIKIATYPDIFVYGHNYSGEYPLDENCRKSGTNLHPKLSISTHLQNPRLTAMLIYLQPTSAFGTQGHAGPGSTPLDALMGRM